jgi:hypothetical protein
MKLFGIDWRKLYRRTDPHTSMEAAKNVNTTKLERIVYDVVCLHPNGCIQDQVLAALPGKPYSSVTARFSSLIRKGLIEPTGETRTGKSGRQQRVLRSTPCQN